MKIAFIYDVVYPEVKGGGEKRLYELGKRLAERHEVHWYTFGWWGQKKIIERDGMIFHSLGKPVQLYLRDIRNPFETIVFSLRLLESDINDYDIIDCQAFPYLPSYSASFKLHTFENLVITWYEYWGDYWRYYLPFGSKLGKFLENKVLHLTDNHIAISKYTLRRLLNIKLGRFGLIPGGIDFEQIRFIDPHPELSYDVVFAGRLIKHKNLQLLLRAIKLLVREIPSLQIAIIGDGPQRIELESLTRKLKIDKNVDFLGFLPSFEDVISVLKSSKVFAFPSLREGFGIVVLEANASGIPVVTVDAPMNASKELIIEGKNGYISKLDEKSFAEKILLAYENSRKMRKTCINIAKKYDWDVIAKKLEKYYEGVLSEH